MPFKLDSSSFVFKINKQNYNRYFYLFFKDKALNYIQSNKMSELKKGGKARRCRLDVNPARPSANDVQNRNYLTTKLQIFRHISHIEGTSICCEQLPTPV